jgi:acetyl/propionyl-CoA carboxylase alpha subunit
MSDREIRVRAVVESDELEVIVLPSGEVKVGGGDAGAPLDARVSTVGDDASRSLVAAGDAVHRARVAIGDGVTWVFLDGDVFQIEIEDAQQETARRRDRSSHDALAAPMPATVSRVLVEVGQTVARGDTLVLLEAMKMEMPIKAPHEGQVAAIRCQPGELVQPGVPLLELEAVGR